MGHVTELIDNLNLGDGNATDELFVLVYHELRAIARLHLAKESSGLTLQATALVNEAFLKISRTSSLFVNDRNHFLKLASRAMQRILVDHARSRSRKKRGGSCKRVSLQEAHLISDQRASELLDLDDALQVLDSRDPDRAELVRLHIFSGLTLRECALVQETSISTIERKWRFIRAWLLNQMAR